MLPQERELTSEIEQLVIDVLETKEATPLMSYLRSASELRRALSVAMTDVARDLQDLFSPGATTDDAVKIYERLSANLEDFEEGWRSLSPPPEATGLHQRQLDVIAETIVLTQRATTALREEDIESFRDVSIALLENATQRMTLDADWYDFLAQVLSQ